MMTRQNMWLAAVLVATGLMTGCVSEIYHPGASDSPLNRVKLGQSYGDMVKALGLPSESVSEDRSSQTFAVAMIPVVGLASLASPTSLQIYHYEHLGKVTIDNNNRIIRVEAE